MAEAESKKDDTDNRIIQFIREKNGFAGTAEVADELDMTTNGAEYRLKNLKSAGDLESRIVSRDKVWHLPEQQTGLPQNLDLASLIATTGVALFLYLIGSAFAGYTLPNAAALGVVIAVVVARSVYPTVERLRENYLPGMEYTVEVPTTLRSGPAEGGAKQA